MTFALLRKGFLEVAESSGVRKVLTGTPVTRSLSRRFVPGERIEDLVEAARAAAADGLSTAANYLGEAVRSPADARSAAETYLRLIDALGDLGTDAYASLKFTQMGQDISDAFLEENLTPVLERARDRGTFLRFDMESSAYTVRTLDAFEALRARGWDRIGVVLQAYLKRTAGDVRRMIDLGAPVRLCKGAYAEPPEWPTRKCPASDGPSWSWRSGSWRTASTRPSPPTTSSSSTAVRDFTARRGIPRDRFEFQLLYGVRRDLQRELVEEGCRVRVYIPFGDQWYPYLMRRLAERPENVAFMVESVVKESPLGVLWRRR
jgi:proline dehydrogenase